MIQLSARGQALYQLLTLTALLLVLYGLGFCLSALARLPASPFADAAVSSAMAGFTERLFLLAVLSGLAAAGFMMAGEGLSVGRVLWLRRLWTALAVVSAALSPLVSAAALDLAAALYLLLLLGATLRAGERRADFRVWQVGNLLAALTLPAAHLLSGRAGEAMRAFQVQVALPVAGLGLLFWLMRRYSMVDADWAADGVRIVAALVFLGGSFISLGKLSLPPIISLGAALLVPLCYIILAGHSYRALRSRNENASLAPHWSALATLFWLVGGGFLGALSLQPGLSQAMRGTDLARAQDWLAQWVLIAIALAFVNEAASSLRGDNRRVTGYVPLWLIAFGAGFAAIVQACRGVVQIYLREVAGLTPSALAESLLPLTALWILCLFAVAAGIATYALGFWLRRPAIYTVDS